jgi:hypothetical protein
MKKNLLIPGLTIVACIAFFGSCIPYPTGTPDTVPEWRQKENVYYVPSTPNTQLLSEKNDVSVNVLASASNQFTGFETQASYLPAKHLGLIAGYSSGKNEVAETYMRFHKFEAGAGYVTPLSKVWHFETYGGIGTGTIDNMHATGNSEIHLTSFFIQPAIAASNAKKTVQFGIISKFSGVNFNVDTAFENAKEPYCTSQLGSLYRQPFHLMWEPGLLLRVGWKNFMFHTSYSASADLTNPDLHRATDNFSIGVSVRFNAAKTVAQ